MSKYGLLDPGTCLPVLEAVCHVFDIDHALEFGCGLWSTSTLARSCKKVTSVEFIICTLHRSYEYIFKRK